MKKEIFPDGEKRPNLLHWYYNEAEHALLEIWKNFLFFVWGHFSIGELFATLLSPWHRDVSFKNWRGFHPIMALQILFENIISRFIGMVVRILVILTGLISFLAVLFLGLLLNILWVALPLIFVAALIYLPKIGISLGQVAALQLVWFLVIIFFYFQDTKKSLLQNNLLELSKHKIFERICGRLGISRKRFPVEILANQELWSNFLKARNLTQQNFAKICQWEIERWQKKIDQGKFWHFENLKKISEIGRLWRYGYTINLDRYCQDLSQNDFTEYAKNDLIGRNDEYEVLKLVLGRPDENCALLVGSPGVGKKTLLHSLARKIRMRQETGLLENSRLLLFDLGRAISDAINKGVDVENFLRKLFYEAANAGNIILIIEHFEYFLGKDSSTFHPDISEVLSEFLPLPSFQIVASSTTREYHQLIEKQDQVAKYFEVIEMREPSEEETFTILLEQLEKYEHGRVLFTSKALEEIIQTSGRHNWESPLPERAIDLAMGVLMYWEKKSDEQFVTEKTVNDYLSLKTGVPQGDVQVAERKKLLNLEAMLHRQVVGQDEAINQVSEALRRARSGIGNSKKPVGSFLFLGPTGVGKTETAKALAKTYFGDESKMIRLDMSEFQTPSSIDRLLGSNHLNQPGRLVTQIKDNPYSLLLLDEIEKAYPEILDVFLQILDEGYVKDAFGQKINFRNTMIIATSNAGASLIKNMVEQKAPAEEIKQAVIDYAIEKNIFRTEFLNRFEGVVFFRPLNENELKSVVRLQLQKLVRTLAKEKNIEITFDENVVANIIQKGYNPIFGARSLNRYIESEVESLVAKKIISGEVTRGEKIVLSI